MKGLIILLLVSCGLAAFCINGLYEYSYIYTDNLNEPLYVNSTVRSYSTVMLLDFNTGKVFSKRIGQIKVGDYVLGHDGQYTYIKNISYSNIQPQLYFNGGLKIKVTGSYAQVNLDIKPSCDNVVFSDSQVNVINKTVQSSSYYTSENSIINDSQFGIANFTDSLQYNIFMAHDNIYYYVEGITIINMAVIVDFLNNNNITEFNQTAANYSDVIAKIYPCEAVEIVTESGAATINGLMFYN